MPVQKTADPEALKGDILEFVTAYIKVHGYSPSLREIAEGVNGQPGTVDYYMKKLIADGKLLQAPGVTRSLRLP